jgi:hypothetical protein
MSDLKGPGFYYIKNAATSTVAAQWTGNPGTPTQINGW